jgi:N-acetylglucosaminyldiphosphoundecaprenol N-acetyl-beta-D-mannosaminyltransferase
VPVDDVTVQEAVDVMDDLIVRFRAGGPCHQVATVNADFVVNALLDPSLLEILQRTSLAIADGMPIVWASRLAGTPLRQRTTGVDLLPALIERAALRGHRVALFGAAPGVAARAADLLAERFPGVVVRGIEAGTVSVKGEVADSVLDELVAAAPDVVGVALGNPKQEYWIARNGATVGAAIYVGIGGTLDFLTGVTNRAPTWMQERGLEWLHRAASEPSRLARRYARDIRVFCPSVLRAAWTGRRLHAAVAPAVETSASTTTVRLLGQLPWSRPEPAIAEVLTGGGSVVVDATAAHPMDNVTLAAIAGLVRAGRRTGGHVRTVGASDDVLGRLRAPYAALLASGDTPAGPA